VGEAIIVGEAIREGLGDATGDIVGATVGATVTAAVAFAVGDAEGVTLVPQPVAIRAIAAMHRMTSIQCFLVDKFFAS
jgi:hypothetical protein